MKKTLKIMMCSTLAMGLMGSQVSWAAYAPSQQAMVTQQQMQTKTEILSLMERSDVRAALEKQGVSAEEAKSRIAMLSPSQLEELKTNIDTIPAGEGAVGAVVGALLIVFFVLLFTDFLGETDAFDFDD